ncbi:helix-turn-helix domain-containing protein [Streptomyces zhihengii]|uniref:helix-turn-helix domain-containing protein n=1 Tax=Streptomyces zhihengii TaxID=1818004 RepID=UPI0033B04F31
MTTENFHLAAARLLAARQRGETSAALMRQITDLRRLLDDTEAAVVGRGRAHGESWKDIGKAAGCGHERMRKKWPQDAVERRLARARENENSTSAESDGLGSDGPPGGSEHPPPLPATDRLAHALRALQQNSGLSIKETGLAIGVSPSHVSRLVAGTRRPSWPVVERFAEACAGDVRALRDLWEAAQHQQVFEREHVPDDPDAAAVEFHTALRALWLADRRPDLWTIQQRTRPGKELTINEITLFLAGTQMPDWESTTRIVLALRGRPAEVRRLWHAATTPPKPTITLPAAAFG